jgi:hypothetical protein
LFSTTSWDVPSFSFFSLPPSGGHGTPVAQALLPVRSTLLPGRTLPHGLEGHATYASEARSPSVLGKPTSRVARDSGFRRRAPACEFRNCGMDMCRAVPDGYLIIYSKYPTDVKENGAWAGQEQSARGAKPGRDRGASNSLFGMQQGRASLGGELKSWTAGKWTINWQGWTCSRDRSTNWTARWRSAGRPMRSRRPRTGSRHWALYRLASGGRDWRCETVPSAQAPRFIYGPGAVVIRFARAVPDGPDHQAGQGHEQQAQRNGYIG